MSIEVHNRLHDLAKAPTIAPPSVYANACRDGAVAIRELRAALKDFVDRCPDCGGKGTAYTMEDETQIGQAPGSSGIDCPGCTKQRAALACT